MPQDLVIKVKAVWALLARYNALITASGATSDNAERLLRFKQLPSLDTKDAHLTASDIEDLLTYDRVREIMTEVKTLHSLLESKISLSVDGATAHIAKTSGCTEAFAETLILSTQGDGKQSMMNRIYLPLIMLIITTNISLVLSTTELTSELAFLDKISIVSILC